ncbi:hypothetical protein CEXT_149451 [Caerostris extrusa]|uniref:Uncharacterized protein n=1 Tax=Caerostris extrusa TaxID=172846 RepID=A0AAV4XR53_CAEEX|nr:hypothetical protein CEXT_149451 [Caerostris extrusa]
MDGLNEKLFLMTLNEAKKNKFSGDVVKQHKKHHLDKNSLTFMDYVKLAYSGGGPPCRSGHIDPVQPGHADAHQLFTLNGRDVPVEIAWVHLREGYPDNVQLVVVDLTDCPFSPHDCRENKYISRRDHAFNVVDPHHGWPLSIGTLGYRQEKFLKEYCGLNSVVDLYRECPHHMPMSVDMEASWANVPISPRFHKGFHRERNAKCSRYIVWYFGRCIYDQQRKLAWKMEQGPLEMFWFQS